MPAGDSFSPGDEALLSTFCARRGDSFALDRRTALAAIEKGHRAGELSRFLEEACDGDVPEAARAFLDDVERRAAMLSITGHAVMVECADPDMASRLASDSRTKHLCALTGPTSILVPAESEADFRRAVRALGYPLLTRATG